MSPVEITMLLFQVLGGLSLFLYGMHVMTGSLRTAAAMLAGFINAGVMTLEQSIAPVFGANIGTSLSMPLVSFHIADVALALLAWPLAVWACEASSPGNLLRQAANLHIFAMVFATLVFLPFTGLFTRLVRLATPSTEPVPEPSFLDDQLLAKPGRFFHTMEKSFPPCGKLFSPAPLLNYHSSFLIA
jgi:Na+/phosphate symporter